MVEAEGMRRIYEGGTTTTRVSEAIVERARQASMDAFGKLGNGHKTESVVEPKATAADSERVPVYMGGTGTTWTTRDKM